LKNVPEQITRQIRDFNRFYIGFIGAVNKSVQNSPFSLAEARVLYEIKHNEAPTASSINVQLDLDPGYLSRIIRRFEQEKHLEKERSPSDGRAFVLRLTAQGERILTALEKAADKSTAELLAPLTKSDVYGLLRSMDTIRSILTADPQSTEVRPVKPGELGIVVSQSMDFYMNEMGLDQSFELFLFERMSRFMKNKERERSEGWVVDHNGSIVGSIFVDREDSKSAKIAGLLLQPEFRKMGLARKLMDEALAFCRENLYQRVYIMSFPELRDARRLYEYYGFSPTEEETKNAWGKEITLERWDCILHDYGDE
jgi:DNA-binding MarR family transcriptional regulator/GNAT superfamily N-acetyltransferase